MLHPKAACTNFLTLRALVIQKLHAKVERSYHIIEEVIMKLSKSCMQQLSKSCIQVVPGCWHHYLVVLVRETMQKKICFYRNIYFHYFGHSI